PTLTYSNASVSAGSSTSNTPTAASDNGSITGYTIQNKGTYTGTISVNSSGVVSISNAQPVGTHTITIRATDNCSVTTDATFTITVTNPILNGTGGGDNFVVTRSGANTVVTLNGVQVFSAQTASFTTLVINGLGGNDS